MTHESAKRQRATYSRWARLYDLSTALASLIYRFDDTEERRKAVERLSLEPGQWALEICVGTGANLPLIAERVGAVHISPDDAKRIASEVFNHTGERVTIAVGVLVGLDVTLAMLRVGARRLDKERIFADLIEGDAAHLPFPDREFDAVLNFGGFNGLDDREAALHEMMRVAKPTAKIVIADQGMSERKRNTFLGKLFTRQDPWLKQYPPVDLLPPGAQDAHVTHFRAENWYLIDFTNE